MKVNTGGLQLCRSRRLSSPITYSYRHWLCRPPRICPLILHFHSSAAPTQGTHGAGEQPCSISLKFRAGCPSSLGRLPRASLAARRRTLRASCASDDASRIAWKRSRVAVPTLRKVRETRRLVARGSACFHGPAATPANRGQLHARDFEILHASLPARRARCALTYATLQRAPRCDALSHLRAEARSPLASRSEAARATRPPSRRCAHQRPPTGRTAVRR